MPPTARVYAIVEPTLPAPIIVTFVIELILSAFVFLEQ